MTILAERVSEQRALATGLVLTVTMIAFEALGVATALPATADDLGGLELYGWVISATMLASLVGIALAGRLVDRHGPAAPYLGGLALFATGLVICGAAPEMWVVVAGRFVQGLGIGALPPIIYASIGRAFTDAARARMFALLSTSWVVPGLVGPALAGAVAETVGWRWVYLGVLPLVAVNAVLAAPSLRRLGAPPVASGGGEAPGDRGLVRRATVLAVAVAVVLAVLGRPSVWAIPAVLTGGWVAVSAFRRLVPAGTLRAAPGLPAAIATRGLQTCAFFTANTFVPLAITGVQGHSTVVAGVALTASTLTWTAGSWLQDKRGLRWGRRTLIVWGLATLAAGLAATLVVLVPSIPVVVAALAFSVAGLGIGMSYSGVSLMVLAAAAPGQEGRATSSMQLSDVLGTALGTGLAQALVALTERNGWPLTGGIAGALALSAAAAALGVVTARRLPRLRTGGGATVGAGAEAEAAATGAALPQA